MVVLDSLEFGSREAVGDTPLIEGDIADETLVAKLIADHSVEEIVHFAAYKAAGESFEKPGRYFYNNVGGSTKLIDSARKAGVQSVVFSSSCAVYGTPQTVPVAEDCPINPESPYGESKAQVERILYWFERCLGLRSVSLRYFNAAGAAMDGSLGEDWTFSMNLVPAAMKALLGAGPPLKIFGTDYPTHDGTAIRDYIHVDDLADAHLKALDYLRAGRSSTAVNLGTGTGSSVREVLAAAERAAGRPVPSQEADRRPGDPIALWADNTRARKLLGWSSRYDLDDIVKSAWSWHSTHL